MTYTSLAQLTDRYGSDTLRKLTDRATPPAGAIDEAVVARALADTDAVIDGYLAGRYRLPLTETPALLADLAQAIAIYKLHRATAGDKVKADHDGAMKTLADIGKGVVRLGVAGIEPKASGTSGVRTSDRERDMTPDNLKGFV